MGVRILKGEEGGVRILQGEEGGVRVVSTNIVLGSPAPNGSVMTCRACNAFRFLP